MDEIEEEKNSIADVFRTARRSLAFSWKKEPKLFIFNILLAVVLAAVVYLQLTSFSQIIDEIVRIKQSGLGVTSSLIWQTLILGISFLIPALLQNLYAKLSDELNVKIGTHVSLHMMDSFSSLDIGTFESSEFQTKQERTQKWGMGSINNVIFYSIRLFGGLAGFATSAFILFSISPYLVLLAILGSLTYYFVEKKYGRELYQLYWINTDDIRIEGDRRSYFKDVKKLVEATLFNIKSFFRNQVKELSEVYDQKVIKVKARESYATFVADFIQTICLFIAIALVTLETLRGDLLVGSLLLAFTVYRSFVSTSQSFFQDLSRLQDQARFAQRWYDLFDIEPRIVSKPDAIIPDFTKPPTIEFKNVSFKYPETEKMVLQNINLSLQSGEKLAIVGENGAGKTTLIKLLCRIYDPVEGDILIDGVNLKDINLEKWRSYMGVLLQDFTNYQMTAREAIAIAKPGETIDDDKVKSAAELSGADTFIQELPKKYDQLIWKGFQDGVELSKGQFQRMAVARIFYRDALISILDEPTSAIDAVAEEKIFEVLETKMEDKTVVLISHRFSTVKNADQIAVIEHGELKELGSHKELMKKDGRYAELYTMQASRYLESE